MNRGLLHSRLALSPLQSWGNASRGPPSSVAAPAGINRARRVRAIRSRTRQGRPLESPGRCGAARLLTLRIPLTPPQAQTKTAVFELTHIGEAFASRRTSANRAISKTPKEYSDTAKKNSKPAKMSPRQSCAGSSAGRAPEQLAGGGGNKKTSRGEIARAPILKPRMDGASNKSAYSAANGRRGGAMPVMLGRAGGRSPRRYP